MDVYLGPVERDVVVTTLHGKNKHRWYQASYSNEGVLESLKPIDNTRKKYSSSESLTTGVIWLHRAQQSTKADREAPTAKA